jgi:hypothetical protein
MVIQQWVVATPLRNLSMFGKARRIVPRVRRAILGFLE